MEALAVMAKKTGPKPNPGGRKSAILAVKCTEEFKTWVEEFARQERISVPIAVELGLVELAKSRGHELPPLR